MQVKETLTLARQFIEKGWTKESFARDKFGFTCNPNDTNATCWCIIGALTATNATDEEIELAEEYLQAALRGTPLISWNDQPNREKKEVLALFDAALEHLG